MIVLEKSIFCSWAQSASCRGVTALSGKTRACGIDQRQCVTKRSELPRPIQFWDQYKSVFFIIALWAVPLSLAGNIRMGRNFYSKIFCSSPQRLSLFVSRMSQKSCWQNPIKIGQEEEKKIKLIFLLFFFLSNELMDPFEWNHMSPTSVHHSVYFMEQRSNITNSEDFASFAEVCTRLCCDYFFSPL